jgi:hypothetical protein
MGCSQAGTMLEILTHPCGFDTTALLKTLSARPSFALPGIVALSVVSGSLIGDHFLARY